MRAPVRLFVYGTLMRGEANHHVLGARAGAQPLAEARTAPRYRLVDLGEYPVLLHGGTVSVRGELYDIEPPALRRLDRFEGHPTLFCRQEVELENGGLAEAYLAGPAVPLAGAVALPQGDWRARASISASAPHGSRRRVRRS